MTENEIIMQTDPEAGIKAFAYSLIGGEYNDQLDMEYEWENLQTNLARRLYCLNMLKDAIQNVRKLIDEKNFRIEYRKSNAKIDLKTFIKEIEYISEIEYSRLYALHQDVTSKQVKRLWPEYRPYY